MAADASFHHGGNTDSVNPSDDLNVNEMPHAQAAVDEEEGPLIKETDHIPIIKERLVQEKISAILTASARGEISHVQEMLEGGDVTFACKDRMDRTPLHIAASEGHDDLVRHLLSLKADPTAKDKFGNTPFNDAVRSKHDNIVSIMKKEDPNIAFKLGGNETGVLMCQAAFHGKIDDIKRLVGNGVDPNDSDYDGRTVSMHGDQIMTDLRWSVFRAKTLMRDVVHRAFFRAYRCVQMPVCLVRHHVLT